MRTVPAAGWQGRIMSDYVALCVRMALSPGNNFPFGVYTGAISKHLGGAKMQKLSVPCCPMMSFHKLSQQTLIMSDMAIMQGTLCTRPFRLAQGIPKAYWWVQATTEHLNIEHPQTDDRRSYFSVQYLGG
jgi:hypothetical protein